jgi:hypothetical protein
MGRCCIGNLASVMHEILISVKLYDFKGFFNDFSSVFMLIKMY